MKLLRKPATTRGEAIRVLAHLRGVSASELAREIGVSVAAISNFVNGRPVSAELEDSICRFFSVLPHRLRALPPDDPEYFNNARKERKNGKKNRSK